MKALVWSLCLVLLACWTAVMALAAQAMRWIAQGLASGNIQDFASGAAQWPAPAGLPAWIDPQWVQMIQSALVSMLSVVAQWSPQLSSIASWLVPLVWVAWAMGLVLLLSLSGVAHWLIGRLRQPPPLAA